MAQTLEFVINDQQHSRRYISLLASSAALDDSSKGTQLNISFPPASPPELWIQKVTIVQNTIGATQVTPVELQTFQVLMSREGLTYCQKNLASAGYLLDDTSTLLWCSRDTPERPFFIVPILSKEDLMHVRVPGMDAHGSTPLATVQVWVEATVKKYR